MREEKIKTDKSKQDTTTMRKQMRKSQWKSLKNMHRLRETCIHKQNSHKHTKQETIIYIQGPEL